MIIPTLETERLRLIPPSSDSFQIYRQFYTDSLASRHYGGPISSSQAYERLVADVRSWHQLGFGVWVIQLKADESLLGTCGYWKGVGWPAELTWWLLTEARGRGFAQEASAAALLYAYTTLNWDTVETYMNDDNVAARNLVESLGGVKTARRVFPDELSRDVFELPKPQTDSIRVP